VMHSCDKPKCINPDHLSVGTYANNTQDALTKGRMRFLSGEAWQAAHRTGEQ
jgi:hypothetical protein